MLQVLDPYLDLARSHAEDRQTAENSGRAAEVVAMLQTTGFGEVAFEDCFLFDLRFVEPPVPSYCPELDGSTLVDSRFPRCSGGVYQYKQDESGLYLGAWCYVVVDTQSPYVPTDAVDPNYTISHWFTFRGVALKDLPDEFLDE